MIFTAIKNAIVKKKILGGFDEIFNALLTDPENAVPKYMDPGVVWENYLPDHVPFGGRYEGYEGIFKYLGELDATLEMGPIEFSEMVVDGFTLVCIGVEKDSKSKTTGKTYNMPFSWIMKFNSSGKLAYVREYNDTSAIAAAYAA